MLDMHDICISIGSACNSHSKERSHVLSAMGLSEEIMDSSVRISMGKYNTKEDVIAWQLRSGKICLCTEVFCIKNFRKTGVSIVGKN